MISQSSRKKKKDIFYRLFCPKRNFLRFVFYLNISSILNTLSEYTYFYISKNNTSLLLVFKIVESLHCIFNAVFIFFFSEQLFLTDVSLVSEEVALSARSKIFLVDKEGKYLFLLIKFFYYNAYLSFLFSFVITRLECFS